MTTWGTGYQGGMKQAYESPSEKKFKSSKQLARTTKLIPNDNDIISEETTVVFSGVATTHLSNKCHILQKQLIKQQ